MGEAAGMVGCPTEDLGPNLAKFRHSSNRLSSAVRGGDYTDVLVGPGSGQIWEREHGSKQK